MKKINKYTCVCQVESNANHALVTLKKKKEKKSQTAHMRMLLRPLRLQCTNVGVQLVTTQVRLWKGSGHQAA